MLHRGATLADETALSDKKTLVRDTLITMYQEQSNWARHHETQRSYVTTIFSSLATALLAIMGALWRTGEPSGEPFGFKFLPMTLALYALGIFGYLITMKLFERSMSHFSLSEAYLNTIDELISDDILELMEGRVTDIKYIKDILEEKDATGDKKEEAWGWDFRPDGEGGRRPKKVRIVSKDRSSPNENEYEEVILEEHNPVNPRPITVPLHNEKERYSVLPLPEFPKIYFARLDLFWLWEIIYFLMVLSGFILTVIASRPHWIMTAVALSLLTTVSSVWFAWGRRK